MLRSQWDGHDDLVIADDYWVQMLVSINKENFWLLWYDSVEYNRRLDDCSVIWAYLC